jgi:two-component system sensor histidine kinase YesM
MKIGVRAMKYWKKRFMDMKIRDKMINSHIFIALIPFCFVGILGIISSTREAERNVTQHTSLLVGQVQHTTDIYISSIEKTANMLIRIIEPMHLNKIPSAEDSRWNEYETALKNSFETVADTHDEIAGIFFATEHDMYVGTGMSRISRDPFVKEVWYEKAAASPGEMQIISNVTGRNIVTEAAYSIDDVFSVMKAVIDPETGERVGVLLFDVKHEIISSAIQDANIGENGFVFVLDEQNHLVYAPTNKIVYRIRPEWLWNEEEPVTAVINGEKYQISYQRSAYTDWKTVSVSSYREIMGGINTMLFMFGWVLVLTILTVFIVAVKISETVTKPIVRLRNLMKETEKGNLSVRFEGNYLDEVSELGRRFNQMLERIQELMEEVYKEQENKRKAQLKAVQEQFKPHFLYNTLDTIGWMAREHSAYDIVHLVDALTNVFRISLSKGKDYITIEEEIRYISNYLYIQKIRYGPKVQYEIQAEEDCMNVILPKMILQPLVENSIYHGVKMKNGDGHLKVTGRVEDDWVSLEVWDDGKGMEEEKVWELTRLLNEPGEAGKNRSFGLFYIKERLRIRYGEQFKVLVESKEGQGTRIVIRIPKEIQCDLEKG